MLRDLRFISSPTKCNEQSIREKVCIKKQYHTIQKCVSLPVIIASILRCTPFHDIRLENSLVLLYNTVSLVLLDWMAGWKQRLRSQSLKFCSPIMSPAITLLFTSIVMVLCTLPLLAIGVESYLVNQVYLEL